MNNTYPIKYTGDQIVKLLDKVNELNQSLGLEIINSADSATKPGVYAIEVEEMALHAKYRQILLVSDYIDEAGIEYASVFQTLFDAQQGKVKTRKQSYNKEQLKYEWTAWETVGEVDLGNYYTKTEIDSKVSSVYKYKGTVPSAMLLPNNKNEGDVYNVILNGYIPIWSEKNYILTGISYEGSLTVDTEITLTFENNVLSDIAGIPLYDCDIAFWFDRTYFFIGKVVSASTNSYVVKVADLDIKDTEYVHNPCFEGIGYYKDEFSNGHITSLTLQSVNYWQNVGSGIKYDYISKGGNVAWTGSTWDSLGATVDTSNFATKNELSNKVNVSDYADYDKFGIVKITSGDGIGIIDGAIYTKIADGSLIVNRSGSPVHEVITPSNLNFAVKRALSDDKRINDMTDKEKENARGVIGAIGSTELNNYYTKTEVDNLIVSTLNTEV